jgi:hypothetical protein
MIMFKERYNDYVIKVICKIIVAFLIEGGTLFLSGIFREYFVEYYNSDPILLMDTIRSYMNRVYP